MRSNVIEKLLVLIMDAYVADKDDPKMYNLIAKGRILVDRNDERAASVIRELKNE